MIIPESFARNCLFICIAYVFRVIRLIPFPMFLGTAPAESTLGAVGPIFYLLRRNVVLSLTTDRTDSAKREKVLGCINLPLAAKSVRRDTSFHTENGEIVEKFLNQRHRTRALPIERRPCGCILVNGTEGLQKFADPFMTNIASISLPISNLTTAPTISGLSTALAGRKGCIR